MELLDERGELRAQWYQLMFLIVGDKLLQFHEGLVMVVALL